MLLVEVKGKGKSMPPEQMGATGRNVGLTFESIVTVKGVVVAHSPVVGVKV